MRIARSVSPRRRKRLPRAKNSANPNSHQSSKSTEGSDLRLRRQGATAGGAQLALELVDFAALREQARQACENPGRGAEGESEEQDQDHRGLPGLPEKEAQRHRARIHERGGEYGEEQQRAQQPGQLGDELLHLTDCRKGGTPPLYPQNLSL